MREHVASARPLQGQTECIAKDRDRHEADVRAEHQPVEAWALEGHRRQNDDEGKLRKGETCPGDEPKALEPKALDRDREHEQRNDHGLPPGSAQSPPVDPGEAGGDDEQDRVSGMPEAGMHGNDPHPLVEVMGECVLPCL